MRLCWSLGLSLAALVCGQAHAAATFSVPNLYQAKDFPNYHYVRFELHPDTLKGEMIRLEDYGAAKPGQWKIRDRFEISLRP
jgi:hypothetical protein